MLMQELGNESCRATFNCARPASTVHKDGLGLLFLTVSLSLSVQYTTLILWYPHTLIQVVQGHDSHSFDPPLALAWI